MENVVNRRSSERHPSFLEDGRVVTDVDVINGCYRLSWRERICFCSGDLAQNLIYQTVSIWLLFYYNNVFGLDSATVAVMFLVVRIIDVVWDPMVGAIVDKSHPRWGKYRSWLILGAVLLATFATLCFWNGFSGSLLYAYVTYVGMSMSFTFVNVPYAALGSSLTRDTDEITILTSVRMVMANLAGLIIKTLPLVIVLFAPKVLNPQTGEMEAVYNTPEAGGAWFITMSIFALVGLVLLLVTFSNLPFKRIADTLNGSTYGLFCGRAFDGEGVGRSTGFGFLNARHFLNGTDYGCLAMAAMHVLNTEDGHIRI